MRPAALERLAPRRLGGSLLAAACGALRQQRAEAGERRAQLVAVDHHVDHAVRCRYSARWKPSGSFSRMVCSMTRGAGKADQRAGLGDVDVAEHRVGGGDAAGRRIGRARRCRAACASRRRCTATVVRGICISERMPSCMRAPPEAAKMMKGVRRSAAVVMPGDDGLARRHAERAAHEVEILHRGDDRRHALELAGAELARRRRAGLGAISFSRSV